MLTESEIIEFYGSQERADLSDCISDAYKDVNGFRPRHICWKTTPLDELYRLRDFYYQEADEAAKRERAARSRSLANLRAQMSKLRMEHDIDELTAWRWMYEANAISEEFHLGSEFGWDNFCWEFDVDFEFARDIAKAFREAGYPNGYIEEPEDSDPTYDAYVELELQLRVA